MGGAVQAEPAVGVRHEGAGQPGLAPARDRKAGIAAGAPGPGGHGPDLGVDEGAHGRDGRRFVPAATLAHATDITIAPMRVDDLVLGLQRLFDRVVRRLRLGAAPPPDRPHLLIVQIDGLSRSVLEQALAERRMPFVARLLHQGWRAHPMCVGLPTSTPAFQMAAMYGVRPDIPAFHYHDRPRGKDVYFPRGGDAAGVERTQAAGRTGILAGGSAYGCVFTGAASNSLFSFSMIKRPTGAGLLRAVSAWVVLGWVVLKSVVLTLVEAARAVLRLVADPVGETARGWRWLLLKIGISVWLHGLFTLAVSRDLYLGVPAVFVNYVDYDVHAHAFGPRHRRALRTLRRVDRAIGQLARVLRRVPGYRYELYILSDHGMAATTPFRKVGARPSVDRLLFDDLLAGRAGAPAGTDGADRPLAEAVRSIRAHRAPGLFQRFVNYLERDFPWILGRRSEERDGVKVVVAGPNALVYFLDSDTPLGIEAIDARLPGLVEALSRSRGVGLVLARSERGPVCVWQGRRYWPHAGPAGPFAGRPDLDLVVEGLRDLMAMPSSGDLVIYGNESSDGHVSYLPEWGAHAGPGWDELHTFVLAPPGTRLPAAIRHPVELYPYFLAYGADQGAAA